MDMEQVIKSSNISEDFNLYGGDCVNIAVALQQVFGGQLVASYANQIDFLDSRPAHVSVRINGELYDGGGKTTKSALRERAYYGVQDQEWDEIVVSVVENPCKEKYDAEQIAKIKHRVETVIK